MMLKAPILILLLIYKDCGLCLFISRTAPDFVSFTRINSKGKSYVDYCAMDMYNLILVKENKCLLISDVFEKLNLQALVLVNCKPSDYSILSFTYCAIQC